MAWHMEATADQADDSMGFSDAMEGSEDDFSTAASNNEDLPQTHPMKRQCLKRKAKNNVKHTRTHLFAASTLFALAKSSFATIIDSGENALGLMKDEPSWATPFNIENPHHVLETDINATNTSTLSRAALHNLTILQNFDSLEDAKDASFTPCSVIDHKVTNVTIRQPTKDSSALQTEFSMPN